MFAYYNVIAVCLKGRGRGNPPGTEEGTRQVRKREPARHGRKNPTGIEKRTRYIRRSIYETGI